MAAEARRVGRYAPDHDRAADGPGPSRGFAMDRRMLIGIKQRAERARRIAGRQLPLARRPPERRHRARRVSVFLPGDREVVRLGVRNLLDAECCITVIGDAGTAAAALASMPAPRPDAAVLDVRLLALG